MRDARFSAPGESDVGPLSFDLHDGERMTLPAASDRAACVAAMLAAAIVKPTSGSIVVASFDSRIQPAACKRVTGYVPHDPIPLAPARFRDAVSYRASLWGIDPHEARERAEGLLARLPGIHEAFAYPFVAALVTAPRLLVLDRPPPSFLDAFYSVAGNCAILRTSVT